MVLSFSRISFLQKEKAAGRGGGGGERAGRGDSLAFLFLSKKVEREERGWNGQRRFLFRLSNLSNAPAD